MRPEIVNLGNHYQELEEMWKRTTCRPEVIYSTLGVLRDVAENVQMSPETITFLVLTMELPAELLIEITGTGVKLFREDA